MKANDETIMYAVCCACLRLGSNGTCQVENNFLISKSGNPCAATQRKQALPKQRQFHRIITE